MKYIKNYNSIEEANGNLINDIPSVVKLAGNNKIVMSKEEYVLRAYDDTFVNRSIYTSLYLTIESMEDNTTFYIFKRKSPTITKSVDLLYSLDNGKTWTLYTMPEADAAGISIIINNGEKILLKGNNIENGFNDAYFDGNDFINKQAYYIQGTGKQKTYGNMMSLVYCDDFIDKLDIPNDGCFGRLFQSNTALIDALYLIMPETCLTKDGGVYILGGCTNLIKVPETIIFSKNIGTSFFAGNTSLTDISYIKYDISKATGLLSFCSSNSNLISIGDLSNWDTSNIVNMCNIFYKCSKLASIGDLSNWNVSKVTNMSWLFSYCYALRNIGDLSNWDVSNVTDMSYMFRNCYILTSVGDLSNWNVSNITTMLCMFYYCYALSSIGDISRWNVSNVTNMSALFFGCISLNIDCDLSNWDTSKVTNMSNMFSFSHNCYGTDDNAMNIENYKSELGLSSFTTTLSIPPIPKGCDTTRILDRLHFLTTIAYCGKISANFGTAINSLLRDGASSLTRESLLKIINALDPENPCTLTINTYNREKLTDDDVKIATDKGWTVTVL